MKNHAEKFERLRTWTNMFANTVEDILPQMARIVEGKTPPDPGATKEQSVELTWHQIEKRLQEVNAAAAEIRQTMFD